jgi:hypothetical protein
MKEKSKGNQVGMGAAAPVKSAKSSAGAQVQKRFISPYAIVAQTVLAMEKPFKGRKGMIKKREEREKIKTHHHQV